MITAYIHQTRIGTFTIRYRAGRWVILFDGENLGGNYLSAQHALDDLAGGHSAWPRATDPSMLGISDDLGDWDPIAK